MRQGKVLITGHAEKTTLRRVFDILSAIGVEAEYSLPERSLCGNSDLAFIGLVDQFAPEDRIDDFIEADELYHLMICHADWLSKKPALVKKAPDFCVLSRNTCELSLRLQRCLLPITATAPHEYAFDAKIRRNMIGTAPVFLQLLKTIRRCADINAPVLISGETGTGKELAARALHYSGSRGSGPFQALNCGAIPDHLIENELFGHAKGAYTDARTAQTGLVAMAEGGSLFLDEVDALSHKAQTTLLRFLQDGSYRELGAGRDKQADVRIITATNRNLEQLVATGEFRQDLMYRLNMLVLDMPSLRQRPEDIPLLTQHFLAASAREFGRGHKQFHSGVLSDLISHSWPGNIRELENTVRRAYLLSDGPLITYSPFSSCTGAAEIGPAQAVADHSVLQFKDAKRLVVDQFEAHYVAELLGKTSGNVSQAARLAGKERRAFGRLVKKHGLKCPDT